MRPPPPQTPPQGAGFRQFGGGGVPRPAGPGGVRKWPRGVLRRSKSYFALVRTQEGPKTGQEGPKRRTKKSADPLGSSACETSPSPNPSPGSRIRSIWRGGGARSEVPFCGRGASSGLRGLQDGPRESKMASKTAQEGPRCFQVRPRSLHNSPRQPKKPLRCRQDAPRGFPEASQEGPKRPKSLIFIGFFDVFWLSRLFGLPTL